MNDNESIKLLLSKSVDLHNRFNGTIEEILRKGNGEEEVARLIESIRYVTDDMERLLKVNKK